MPVDTSKDADIPKRTGEGSGPGEFIPRTTFRGGRERDLETNEIMLSFKREEMNGKVILELGSGEKEALAADFADAGIKATVISLNPDFINNHEYREEIQQVWDNQPLIKGLSVGAIAQYLPFKNESVDEIFANHSLSACMAPWRNKEGAKMWANEIARVLKKGGKARIYPVTPKFFDKDGYTELFAIWKMLGLEVEIVPIKTVDLLGDISSWHDTDDILHEEKRDPNEALYHTLIIKKTFG